MVAPFRASIGDVDISVSINETHAHAATVTDNPIETGSSVTDHVQISGVELTMESLVSDAPSADPDEAPALSPASAYLLLQRLFKNREPFDVRTSLATYENMVVRRLAVTRNKDTGAVLRFTAELKQLLFAHSETVLVPAPEVKPLASKSTNLGQKGTTPAPDAAAAKSRSALSKITNSKVNAPKAVAILDDLANWVQ